jgi:Asp-tRNA(Asn)/Glu-tRNA(Gln) amidotransferase A subunit family amidase
MLANPFGISETDDTMSFISTRDRFRSGHASPRDVLERCIEQIETRESSVRAFAALDVESARRAADAATARYHAGTPLSSIDGMPIALKDILETADLPTGFGSAIFKDWRGGRDSAVAYALRMAGAVILGKAVTTEFADREPGPTRNPHDPTRTPGGSSSGSAAAVAAGMVPVAIGSQVGGSILRPASFCGVIGFKPSFGAINRGGISDNFSQNCLGTLSANLDDAWAVCHEIAIRVGGDPGFPAFDGGATPAPPRRPDRLAVLETAGWAIADADAKAAFEAYLATLSAQGIQLTNRRTSHRVEVLEQAIADALDVSQAINHWEKAWPLGEIEHRYGDGVSAHLRKGIAAGRAMTPDQYHALLRRRDAMRDALLALAGDCDACVALAAPGIAPKGIEATGNPIFNYPGSALRTPAVSLPLLAVDGLPLGVQLLGYPQRERELSALAGYLLGGTAQARPA